MATAHSLALVEYAHTDLAKASAIATLDLNDGASYSVVSFVPMSGMPNSETGEYDAVPESIILQLEGTVDNAFNAFANLNLWGRKCVLWHLAGNIGNEVWLRWKHQTATNYSYAKVYHITAQHLGNKKIEVRVTRDGLWWGDYGQAYISNDWTARTNAAAITITNHLDHITHVYDYGNDAAIAPYEGGSYADGTTYLLCNADGVGQKITEVGDGVYIGCTDDTFSGFEVRINVPAVYDATLVWEYWNGAAWTSFTPTDPTSKFTAAQSDYLVSWTSLANWATKAINTVTAYWVRLRCSAFTGATSGCTAGYGMGTITSHFGLNLNWRSSHENYIKIAAADVDGDAPALIHCKFAPSTATTARIRLAKRSIGTVPTATSFVSDNADTTASTTAWAGGYVNIAAPASTFTAINGYIICLTSSMGLWRLFLRTYCVTSATTAEFESRVICNTSTYVISTGAAVSPPIADNWCIADLGMIILNPGAAGDISDYRILALQRRSSGAEAIREDELIMLPVDEFYHVAEPTKLSTSNHLWFSPIDNTVRTKITSSGYENEQCTPMGQELTAEPNRDNYFFFLYDRASDVNTLTDKAAVTLYIIPRYVAMRGTT